MNPEDQALIEAHVERLVAAELAHRKEIATLQAMVVELRGRLAEAERLLRCYEDYDTKWVRTGIAKFLAASPTDSPTAATITLSKGPDAGTHPWPATPPASTVDRRLAALEARVAALEKLGKGEAGVSPLPHPFHAYCCSMGRLDPIHAVPGEPEAPHAFVGEGSATGHYLGRCRECHCEPSAAIHAVPGAAK